MTILVYDLGGGTFRRDPPATGAGRYPDAGHRRGRPARRTRLGSAAGRLSGGALSSGPREGPARQSEFAGPTARGRRRCEADAQRPKESDHCASRRTDNRSRFRSRREQFEELTADLLERTAYTTRQILMAAGIRWNDVSRVLLVGGSSRMPMVERMIRDLSGLEPDHTVNPDEAVARGAALYARFLTAMESDIDDIDFEVVDVNAHSLGIDGIDPETLRRMNVVMLPRNTALPAKITKKFVNEATRSGDDRRPRFAGRELAAGLLHVGGSCRAPRAASRSAPAVGRWK